MYGIIAGIIAGFIASKLTDGKGKGCLIDLFLGIVGGWVGGWLFSLLGLHTSGDFIGQIVTGAVGAAVVLWLFKKLR